MTRGWLVLLILFVAQLAASCATSPTSVGVVHNTTLCPVSDIEVARGIAVSVIAGQSVSGRQSQTGYRIDVSDEGRFWSVRDGPNAVTTDEDLVQIQFGGSSVSFKIAKCSGAISDFTMSSWK